MTAQDGLHYGALHAVITVLIFGLAGGFHSPEQRESTLAVWREVLAA